MIRRYIKKLFRHEKEIETGRLSLRHWRSEDAPRLYELARNPEIGNSGGWPAHESVSKSREVIEKVFNDENVFAVVLKETNEIIGCVGLAYDTKCPISKNERILGYWLGKEYFGHGYATEAVKALIDYGFRYRGYDGIWCDTYPENIRSANVQRKCGFRITGESIDSLWGAGDGCRKVMVSYLPNPANTNLNINTKRQDIFPKET